MGISRELNLKKKEAKALRNEWAGLCKQKEKLDKEIKALADKTLELEAQIIEAELPAEITPEIYMSWDFRKQIHPRIWNRLQNWFDSNYAHKFNGVWRSGIYSDTGQTYLLIMIDRTKTFESQLGFIDFRQYVKSDHVGIFHKGQHCFDEIILRLKPKIVVQKRVYSDEYKNISPEWTCIRPALKWIYDNCPYRIKEDD